MNRQDKIYSPLDGIILAKEDVKDPVFKEAYFGKSITLYPESDKIVSPVDGTVLQIAKDGHSILIQAENHSKIWIYIGNDVVNLDGAYIDTYVKELDFVSVGTLLLNCDFCEMERRDYKVEVSVLVLQQAEVFDFIPLKEGRIKQTEELAAVLLHGSVRD